MLRFALLILVLANAGYYVWSHGHLAQWGLAPAETREPQRLAQQIRPEALRLLPTAPSAGSAHEPVDETPAAPVAPEAVDTSAPVATSCLQSPPMDERQAEALRRALIAQVASAQWEITSSQQPGRWMVYMGKFPDTDILDKKRAELRARKIDNDRAGGSLEPGISLGRFSSEQAATRELTQLARQGVRTARVVQERPDVTLYSLRLPQASAALRSQVEQLPGDLLAGKPLRACPAG